MTSEERERLNSLAVGIQEEKDYQRFAAQVRRFATSWSEKLADLGALTGATFDRTEP